MNPKLKEIFSGKVVNKALSLNTGVDEFPCYSQTYDEILARTRAELPHCRILLIDPFYLSTETSPNSWRRRVLELLPAYIGIVHQMREKYCTRLVETHVLFQRLLCYNDADTFCAEPVHPNAAGHLAIAEAVYTALSAD